MLDWNELAKGLYRKLGARHMEDWEPWRIEGAELKALGGGGEQRQGCTIRGYCTGRRPPHLWPVTIRVSDQPDLVSVALICG